MVQEAVTNAISTPLERRSTSRSSATPALSRYEWSISRPFPGVRASKQTGGGHGLAGMRERVTEVGGTLSAGPTPEGGWEVVARLPRHPRRQAAAAQPRALRWR